MHCNSKILLNNEEAKERLLIVWSSSYKDRFDPADSTNPKICLKTSSIHSIYCENSSYAHMQIHLCKWTCACICAHVPDSREPNISFGLGQSTVEPSIPSLFLTIQVGYLASALAQVCVRVCGSVRDHVTHSQNIYTTIRDVRLQATQQLNSVNK